MGESWIGLVGVIIGAVAVSGTTLVTEWSKRRDEQRKDEDAHERTRREDLRKVILRTEAAITALALDKRDAAKLRTAFDEATACDLEFGLLIRTEDRLAGDAITNAIKAAMRAQTADQISWISVAVSGHLPRWYRHEISAKELSDIIGSVTSRIPANAGQEAS